MREGQGTPITEKPMYHSLIDPYMTTRDEFYTEGVLLHLISKCLLWEGQGQELEDFSNLHPTHHPTQFNLRFLLEVML